MSKIAREFVEDERLQDLLARLGLIGKVLIPRHLRRGLTRPARCSDRLSLHPAALTPAPHRRRRVGWAQVHMDETRKGLPRIVWSNLHVAFARMNEAKNRFSDADKAHVAASPFMQLMWELHQAAPGMTIVVQFSAGVEMHVDYRHLHGSALRVRAPRPHRMPQKASPAACTCRSGQPLDPNRLLLLCHRPSSNSSCSATRAPPTSLRPR